jgi:hypothetical protein
VTCPQEPIPLGWKVWRSAAVPTPLEQFAIDVRDHINQYTYGQVVATTDYNGQRVGAFKSHHTWTYRRQPDGTTKLVTGICIPGVSLVLPVAAGVHGVGGTQPDSLSTPDPTAAVYGADDLASARSVNWGVVAATAAVVAVTAAAFWAAVHFAGTPRLR